MRKKINRVIDQLCQEGLSMAIIETPAGDFVYPTVKDQPKYGNKFFLLFIILASLIAIVAGKKILDRQTALDQQKNINRVDSYGMSLLFHAVIENDLEKTKTLVQSGASVNIQDHYGWTPLHWAIFSENPEICQYLIQQKADIRIKSTGEWFTYPRNLSPVEMAKIIKSSEIKEILNKNRPREISR